MLSIPVHETHVQRAIKLAERSQLQSIVGHDFFAALELPILPHEWR